MTPDYQPTATPRTLQLRSHLLRQLRNFFYQREFVEVETPILSQDTVIDLYLDPIIVPLDKENRYLQTSPEFGMKRLLSAELPKIFQITRAFRSDESGGIHNPEFTMLEWYRCEDSYQQGRQLLADLINWLLSDPCWEQKLPLCQQRTFAAAFVAILDLHPFHAPIEQLLQAATQSGFALDISGKPDDALLRRECLNFLWGIKVDPQLGQDGPEIIYDWPAADAALSETSWCDDDGDYYEVAHRYELYLHGLELANGYHELLDPRILAERNAETNKLRRSLNKTVLPEDSRLLSAMQAGIPPSCGVAVGVDRLLLALLQLECIAQVQAFPWNRA